MKVVAISGFKGSGKDTCANRLIEKHGFKRVAFADPLKDMVSNLYKIERSSLDDINRKEKPLLQYPAPATDKFTSMISEFMVREFRTESGFPPDVPHIRNNNGYLQTFENGWENLYHTPRSLAILIGSSMRSGHPDFWVKKAIEDIKLLNNDSRIQGVVISDLRYQSECESLRKAFGHNLVTVRINRFEKSPSADPSELDLVGYKHDIEIPNEGNLEELYNYIDRVVRLSW